VTGADTDLADKVLHDPEEAAARVRAHAEHFVELVRATLADAPDAGILVAPFDAELFGHWWFEGVDWLEEVLVRLHADPTVRLASLAEHLDRYPPSQIVRLPEGSWGAGGRHDVWANPTVGWTWRSIHRAEEEVWALVERARRSPHAGARRIAAAALRQLLLLVSSDWQFLITTGSAVDYATARLELHSEAALRLADLGRRALVGSALAESDRAFVDSVEARDDPFPHLADVVNLGEQPRAFAAAG
jgi:1,4-alpha-glucan branching enzyme